MLWMSGLNWLRVELAFIHALCERMWKALSCKLHEVSWRSIALATSEVVEMRWAWLKRLVGVDDQEGDLLTQGLKGLVLGLNRWNMSWGRAIPSESGRVQGLFICISWIDPFDDAFKFWFFLEGLFFFSPPATHVHVHLLYPVPLSLPHFRPLAQAAFCTQSF